MERLTQREGLSKEAYATKFDYPEMDWNSISAINEVVDKLAAYEDLGFNPEELEEMIEENKQLSIALKETSKCLGCIYYNSEVCIDSCPHLESDEEEV